MTVIACDMEAGVMVADSKVTILNSDSYPAIKIIKVKTRLVGACGHNGDCTRFLEWAKREFKGAEPKWTAPAQSPESVEGIVMDTNGIYLWHSGDPEPECMHQVTKHAVGSGGGAARVAMMLGKSAEEAVQLACQVDDNCGPPLQVLKL